MKKKLLIAIMMTVVLCFGCGKAESTSQESETVEEAEEILVEEEPEIQEETIDEEPAEVETVETEAVEDDKAEPDIEEKAAEEIPEEETVTKEEITVEEEGRVVELSRSDVLFSESIGDNFSAWVDRIAPVEEQQKLIGIMKNIPKEEIEKSVSVDELYTLPDEGGTVTILEDEANGLFIYGYTSMDHYMEGLIIKYDGVWSYVHSSWDRKGFTRFHLGDFDHDGMKEVAQISPGEQGTGVIVERLLIFEKQQDGTLKANQFLYDEQTEQVFYLASFYKDTGTNQFIVKTPTDGEILLPWDGESVDDQEVNLDMEYIRRFEIEGDQIRYKIDLGVNIGGISSYQEEDCGTMNFNVQYHNGEFSLR